MFSYQNLQHIILEIQFSTHISFYCKAKKLSFENNVKLYGSTITYVTKSVWKKGSDTISPSRFPAQALATYTELAQFMGGLPQMKSTGGQGVITVHTGLGSARSQTERRRGTKVTPLSKLVVMTTVFVRAPRRRTRCYLYCACKSI
jgi:hypothetical protein